MDWLFKRSAALIDLTSPDLPPYSPVLLASRLQRPIARWLDWWHGHGDWHQADYFRCHGCRALVTWKAIAHGGCDCKSSAKLSPVRMTRWIKCRLIFAPWTARH